MSGAKCWRGCYILHYFTKGAPDFFFFLLLNFVWFPVKLFYYCSTILSLKPPPTNPKERTIQSVRAMETGPKHLVDGDDLMMMDFSLILHSVCKKDPAPSHLRAPAWCAIIRCLVPQNSSFFCCCCISALGQHTQGLDAI